jgi:hypothetical protein
MIASLCYFYFDYARCILMQINLWLHLIRTPHVRFCTLSPFGDVRFDIRLKGASTMPNPGSEADIGLNAFTATVAAAATLGIACGKYRYRN